MQDILVILSPLVIVCGAIVLLLVDRALADKRITGWIAAALALGALAAAMAEPAGGHAFSGMVISDTVSNFSDGLLAMIALVVAIMALRYNGVRGILRGEFFVLVLFAASGMMLVGHAANLLIIFVGIELLSIPLYVLCGFARPRVESEESSLKYFLLGAFASGFLVFGIALVYGATGSLNFAAISQMLAAGKLGSSLLMLSGAGLILAGLGFKVAAVPFHMWTPDVYDGAPTLVTAFMATATKTAAFAAIVRVFLGALAPALAVWQPAVAVLAALTMVIGNVGALAQSNVKRMLAYSSIAHAGYLLAGVASGAAATAAILFYLAAYALTTLAAFGVLALQATGDDDSHGLERYRGLGRTRPVRALVLTVALFSLMGMPPTAGFAGKYLLFQSAIAANLGWLAVLGVLTSVISAYYYLRVVVAMFMSQGEPAADAPAAGRLVTAPAVVMACLTLVVGILPTLVLNVLPRAAELVAAR